MVTDVAIIGAGFAGASTAFHLARSGFTGSTVILEQEEVPGFHASGRNASLVLQSVDHPEVREIVSSSVGQYLKNASEIGYAPLGSLLLGTPSRLEDLRDTRIVQSRLLDPGEARQMVPVLRGHDFEAALWTPADGVMDVSRLLGFYLEGARSSGVALRLNCRVSSLSRSGDSFEIGLPGETLKARVIVNAAGAWAPAIATMLGIEALPMRSFKRHLFILDGIQGLGTDWPFVWSLDRQFYFRPESGGLLFSVCDEEEVESDFVQTVNHEVSEHLAELIADQLPELGEALQRRFWSCFRTKTPHGSFHLGWSDKIENLLWVAGLGGHGMGASWEIGRRAAELLARREPD